MRPLLVVTLALALTGIGSAPAVAVTGYDSAYAGESAFLTLTPGQAGNFQVFFMNTGTTTWSKGTATQVDLAACLEDKVTCLAQDQQDASFNNGWLSAVRYATTAQTTVATGEIATFSYSIVAPQNAAGTTHRFNGDLVTSLGARIHPEGYYQDAKVAALATPAPTPVPTPAPTPTPTPTPTPAPTPTPPTLTCFDGTTDTANGETGGAIYGGTCTKTGAASAILNNVPPGRDGEYSGVYYVPDQLKGDALASITNLGFDFTGSVLEANGPRISMPIDGDVNEDPLDGATDFYLFIDALHCNDGAGHVRPLTDEDCLIFYTGGPVGGETWSQIIAGHPNWKVATAITFVIADGPGAWTVSNVRLG